MRRTARAVTIASRVFEPEGSAAAFRLGALVRSLQRAGFSTTVLTSTTPVRTPKVAGVRRWPVLRDRTGSVRGYLQYASFDIPLFFRLLFGPRADVVIVEPPPTTGIVARAACAIRHTPYIYFSADVSTTAAIGIGVNPLVVSIVRALESWTLRGARAVLAVSQGVRDEVIALGARAESVAVVGTGIDTSAFSSAGPTPEVDYPYLVYAGTMSEIQGAGVFVDAFLLLADRHPTARLLMFGSGVEFAELSARAAHSGNDRILIYSSVGAEELAPWLRGAHAGLASVRPARGYDFAFATKALVSLSCGTPVIYAGVGPMAPLTREFELGWACEWDSAEVAAAMDVALASAPERAERIRLSEWAQSRFSLDAVGDIAVGTIENVIDELQRPA